MARRAVSTAMPYSSERRPGVGIIRSGANSPDEILAATTSASCMYSGRADFGSRLIGQQ